MLVDNRSAASKVAKAVKPERWNDPHAHVALKRLYEERVPPGMSQAEFGAIHGIGTQGMVWQYLNGHTPLPLEAAAKFARALRCTIYEISPPMAEALKAEIMPVLGPKAWLRAAGVKVALAGFAALPFIEALRNCVLCKIEPALCELVPRPAVR
jgi:hypothetical protein